MKAREGGRSGGGSSQHAEGRPLPYAGLPALSGHPGSRPSLHRCQQEGVGGLRSRSPLQLHRVGETVPTPRVGGTHAVSTALALHSVRPLLPGLCQGGQDSSALVLVTGRGQRCTGQPDVQGLLPQPAPRGLGSDIPCVQLSPPPDGPRAAQGPCLQPGPECSHRAVGLDRRSDTHTRSGSGLQLRASGHVQTQPWLPAPTTPWLLREVCSHSGCVCVCV